MSDTLTSDRLREILNTVTDPELPMVSVVELGIVRAVRSEHGKVVVTITPTYSGCPAMDTIEADITAALLAAGAESVTIERVYAPPWTTDWIAKDAYEKLAAAGIAPPASAEGSSLEKLVSLPRSRPAPPCPRCGSVNTTLTSEYGPTSCKALCVCNDCREPFEYMKSF